LAYKRIAFVGGHPNLSIIHYIYYFAFYFLGAGTLFLDRGFENELYFFSATLYPLVSVLGALLVNEVYKGRPNCYLKFSKNSCKGLYVFIIIIVAGYCITIDTLPLTYALRGETNTANIARSLVTKEFQGPKILYYSFRLVIDYLSIFLVIYFYQKKNRITLGFVVMFIVVLIISALDTQKYPAINILVLFSFFYFFYHIMAKNKQRFPMRSVISVGAVVAISLYLMLGFMHMKLSSKLDNASLPDQLSSVVAHANSMLQDRLLFGQNRALYTVYEIVPEKYDYFLGSTFPNPKRILPFEPVPLTYLVYDEIHPEAIGGPIRGSAPSVFYSAIYANFGIVISFISMFFFGAFMQFINNAFLVRGNDIVPYRFMWMNYMTLFSLSISFIYDERFLFLVILYFLLFTKIQIRKNLYTG